MKKSSLGLLCALLGVVGGLSVGAVTFAFFYDHGDIAIVRHATYAEKTQEFGAELVHCNLRSFGMVTGHTVIVEGVSSNHRYHGGYMNKMVRIKPGFEVMSQVNWGLVNTPPGGTADDQLRVVATACREGVRPDGIVTISYDKH